MPIRYETIPAPVPPFRAMQSDAGRWSAWRPYPLPVEPGRPVPDVGWRRIPGPAFPDRDAAEAAGRAWMDARPAARREAEAAIAIRDAEIAAHAAR